MKALISIHERISIVIVLGGFLYFLVPTYLPAQGVVISEEDADPAQSAILDVQSTDKGMLVPRMNRNQRNTISSPTTGLLIYQTDNTPGFYYYTGSAWESLKSTDIEFTEEDPQVGTINNNRIPKWDGEKLVSSGIVESDERVTFNNTAFFTKDGTIRLTDNIKIYSSDGGDLNDADGIKAKMEVADRDYAYLVLNGQNDQTYVRIGSTYDAFNPNTYGVDRGAVYLFNGEIDGISAPVAGMEVAASGQSRVYADRIEARSSVSAVVKNFVVPHPSDPTKEIVYASIEGPEAAMYARGTTQLAQGKATITLPEHFRLMAVESSMTVILTPLSGQSKGLAVTKKSLERGISVEELMEGNGNYQFDWEVKSIRKGFEDHEVVREKQMNSSQSE